MSKEKLLEILQQKPFTKLRSEILEEALKAVKEKCRRCVQDRMRMILAPLCGPSRPLLTVQILAGIPRAKLPLCLEVRVSEVRQLLKGIREPSRLFDAVLPADLFFHRIMNTKEKDIPSFLKKNNIRFMSSDNYILFQLNSILCVYDKTRNIVIVNPQQLPIENMENALLLTKFLLGEKDNVRIKTFGKILLIDIPLKTRDNPGELLKKIHSKFLELIEHISVSSNTLLIDVCPISKTCKLFVKFLNEINSLIKRGE